MVIFKNMEMRLLSALVLLFSLQFSAFSQSKFTVSGYIRDSLTGETLIGVNIYVKEKPSLGSVTNEYGFYSVTLADAPVTLIYSYIGYDKSYFTVSNPSNQRINVNLMEGIQINEVVISAKQEDRNVSSTEMSTISLPVEKIKKLPALFGEVDILKSLQLLPGVQFGGEGNSGFYVRGGGSDQNLI